MYEHFLCMDWSLAMADRNMLEYSIDTYSGKVATTFTMLLG